MPIYEYRCAECKQRSSVLILNAKQHAEPSCRHCGSGKVERLMSRFAAPKSEDARIESMTDPSHFGDVDENDPKSMARFMKKMSREMGEDLGDDFDEALEETGEGMAEPGVSDLD